MERAGINTIASIVSVVLAAVVLPPSAAVPVLTFLIGLLIGIQQRSSGASG